MQNSEIILTSVQGIQPEELAYLEAFTEGLAENKLRLFLSIYNGKRQRPDTILLLSLLGFVGFAGIQRFVVRQVGMGILYFFTAGLCLIGTIVDLVNHKSIAFEFNQEMAIESMNMVK